MEMNRLEKLLEFIKSEPNDEFLKYALATEYLRLNETNKALQIKLNVTQEKFAKLTPDILFDAGRDLWRAHPPLKKLVANSQLAEIAAELIEQKLVRLGYDEYITVPKSEREPFSSHVPSGSNLTFESEEGFPADSSRASLAHANRNFHHSQAW